MGVMLMGPSESSSVGLAAMNLDLAVSAAGFFSSSAKLSREVGLANAKAFFICCVEFVNIDLIKI